MYPILTPMRQYKVVELLSKQGASLVALNAFNEKPFSMTEDATMIRLYKVWYGMVWYGM